MVSEKIKDDKKCPESQAAILAVVRTLIVRKYGGSSWNDIGKILIKKKIIKLFNPTILQIN